VDLTTAVRLEIILWLQVLGYIEPHAEHETGLDSSARKTQQAALEGIALLRSAYSPAYPSRLFGSSMNG
jgi:hypothetical protein